MKSWMWIAAVSLSLLIIPGVEAQGDKEEKLTVRPLKFAAKDPTVIFSIGGKASATTLADADAVAKLVGKKSAQELIDAVDLAKEMIVFVSWNTSGPPDGTLKYEVKGAGKDRKLTFYVQGPVAGKARGQRLRIGADFFAVPRNVAVSFDPKERN
jgi:hypothetical protein